MTIILLSLWFGKKGESAFKKEVTQLGPSPKVAIIHNGLRFKLWRTLNNWFISYKFRKLGCKSVFIDLTRRTEIITRLEHCSIVYLGSGDTRRFKKILQEKTSAGIRIVDHLTRVGGILIGASAGAIVCGTDIRTGDMLGDSRAVKVRSKRALNLLPDQACILPHSKSNHSKIIAREKANGFPFRIWQLREGESMFILEGQPYRYD